MCGRYKRTSDKQRIAEAFHVAAGLDELPDEPGDDLCPQSLQSAISTNDHGERQIEPMRWAFNSRTSFSSMLDPRGSITQSSGRMPF
jgi:putative SOS response-associated peptidase YedK